MVDIIRLHRIMKGMNNMTINEFVNNSPFKIPEHIIVYGETSNDVCHEIHKVYDSQNPRCKDGMSDLVKNMQLHSISGSRWDPDALVLCFVTDRILNEYL